VGSRANESGESGFEGDLLLIKAVIGRHAETPLRMF